MIKPTSSFASLLAVTALAMLAPTTYAQERVPDPVIGDLPPAPQNKYFIEPPGVSVETYADSLEVIWSIEFAPDGRLFFTEKPGRIRTISPDGELDPTPWATIDVNNEALGWGLRGLAFHPNFPDEPWVYVSYTLDKPTEVVHRVSRFREVDGRAGEEEVIFDDIQADATHNGGRIVFGPDGMLYIGTGYAGPPMDSQDLSNPAGSILRVTPTGEVPPDNPWPGNPIWAYGLRNPNALAFRPSDGALFNGDNGPTGEWVNPRIGAYDEVNIIERGANYGWPLAVGAPGKAGLKDPLLAFIPSVPPGDMVFYDGTAMPQFYGDLFYATLWSEALLRIRFDDPDDPNHVTGIERWFTTPIYRTGAAGFGGESVYGRLRGIAVGPDGAIYVGTSNQDDRFPPDPGDDRILRIAPLDEEE